MKFQLTSSRRGWQNQMFFHCWVFSISTHILTKRMTGVWNTSSIKCSYFNSHPHEEDDANSADIASLKTFQLTSSRRGWHARSVLSYYGWIFQLTSSRRGWLVFTLVVGYYSLFQLTSSRRGWLSPACHGTASVLFQLTSSRRGWLAHRWHRKLLTPISTHILTKRMTYSIIKIAVSTVFQLTSSRRGWPWQQKQLTWQFYFNSHPHEEDDYFFLCARNL